jgi:glutathione S-transferase
MKLFGSKASPFVRRVKLHLKDTPYEYKEVKVFSPEGQTLLKQLNPIRRIPVLKDGEQTIIDSSLIIKHLTSNKWDLQTETYNQYLNDAGNAAILLFQLKYFKLDPSLSNEFSKNQIKILKSILYEFNQLFENNEIAWDPIGLYLYCLLDWMDYREVYNWQEKFGHLVSFFEEHRDNKWVKKTDPRT